MKVFSFVKKVFVSGLTVLSNSVTDALNCVSMNNQECKVRPKIVDINSNNPMIYPFGIKVNKCSGNCNNINNPYAKICVPDTVKDLNIRVFNLMSRNNETRHIEWHKTCNMCDKCDKSCNIGEYLDYSSCKCRKKLVDPLVEECTENINETKVIKVTVESENKNSCRCYVVCKLLFVIFFMINIVIIIYFVDHVYANRIKYNLHY